MLDNYGMDSTTGTTIKISYDNGITSGSGNPGWMYQDENGDWRPLSDPFGPLSTLADDWGANEAATLSARIRRLGYNVEVA